MAHNPGKSGEVRDTVRSWAAVAGSGAGWIAVALLAAVCVGFDPLWLAWDPAWLKTLETNPSLRAIYDRPQLIGLALALVLTLLYVLFWFVLRRGASRAPHPAATIAVALLATGCTIGASPFLSSDPLLYVHYAHVATVEGANPYLPATGPVNPVTRRVTPWAAEGCAYGPLVLHAASSLYDPDQPARRTVIRLRLVWTLLFWLLAWDAFHRIADADCRRLVLWFLLANPLVVTEVTLQVHSDLLLVVLWYAALVAAGRGRDAPAAFLLTASLAVKPVGLLLLPVLVAGRLWARGARALPWLAGGLLAGVGLVAALYAPYWEGWATLAPLARESQRYLKSLAALGALAFGADPRIVTALGAAALLGAMGAAVWRARSFDAMVAGMQAVLLVYLLAVVPFLQPWYLLWFVPLAAACPALPASPRWVAGGAVFTIGALWGSYGISLARADRGRPLVWMSALCILPMLAYLAWVLFEAYRRRRGQGERRQTSSR